MNEYYYEINGARHSGFASRNLAVRDANERYSSLINKPVKITIFLIEHKTVMGKPWAPVNQTYRETVTIYPVYTG